MLNLLLLLLSIRGVCSGPVITNHGPWQCCQYDFTQGSTIYSVDYNSSWDVYNAEFLLCPNPREIIIRHVETISFNRWSFYGLQNVTYLQVIKSRLKSPPPLMAMCPSLLNIDYTQNEIKGFPMGYFDSCSKLEILYLAGNQLKQHGLELEPMKESLRYLDLSENLIEDVKNITDIKFSSMQVVNFGNNLIMEIDMEAVANWQALRDIYIAENLLSYLPDPAEYNM